MTAGVYAYESMLLPLAREREAAVVGLRRAGGEARSLHGASVCAPDLAAREACRMLGGIARRRGVKLTITAQELPMLPMERSTVCGLVLSLVKTAIDASSSGAEVLVDVLLVGGWLTLIVADEGDIDRTTALEACEEVVEASGGTLSVSSVSHGTVVIVRVPLQSTLTAGM